MPLMSHEVTLRRKAASSGFSASRSLLGRSGVCRPSSGDAPPAPPVPVVAGSAPRRVLRSTICRRSFSAASLASRSSCARLQMLSA